MKLAIDLNLALDVQALQKIYQVTIISDKGLVFMHKDDRGIKMNENFNTITVMDYTLNEVRVYRNVETDDPEKWLQEHDENWNENTCYYMYGNNTEVKEHE